MHRLLKKYNNSMGAILVLFRLLLASHMTFLAWAMWLCSTLDAMFSLPVFAQDQVPNAPGQPAAALYHDYCSVCHGDKGDGRSRASNSLSPPPRDFTAPAARTELSRERMILSVREGRPGTAMTAWKTQLNTSQIEAVVDYVRGSFMLIETAAGAELERGRRIYGKTCSVCHGDRGNGSLWASQNLNPAPRDFSSAQASTELTRERMIAAVTNGKPGTAMVGFARQLSAQEIDAVVNFVRVGIMGAPVVANNNSAKHSTVTESAPQSSANTAMPNGLQGNRKRGGRFYASNCSTCHGIKGDGNGPRAYFINPKPRNFLAPDSRARLNRPALYYAIALGRLGSEMPAWDKVLSNQEIANVAEFVYQDFILQVPDRRASTAR